MAVTIYDVAKLARVGIGTVSRAINNSQQIKPETKERVMRAIEELGYTPHAMAQGLARRKTGIIAAIMPFYTGHFYHELMRGMQRALVSISYDLILYYVEQSEKRDHFLDRTLREKRCDGVLVISMDVPEEFQKKYAEAELPMVLVDRSQTGIDSVRVENEDGALQATRYLISHGHRRIAMISGNSNSMPARERHAGYVRALREAGIEPDEQLYLPAERLDAAPELQENDGFNEKAGQAATEKLLQESGEKFTAIFGASDILTIGAMKAIRAAGLRIPEDIALVGFDDIELSSYLGLSTMKQPMFDMGNLAVKRLMEKIENKDTTVKQIILSPQLVLRDSSG